MEHVDVAIVGAGFAGMTAARALKNGGLSVCLLEARARVGGRVWTTKNAASAYPVELGAEFIHGAENPLWDFLNEMDIPAHDLSGAFWSFKGGRLVQEPSTEDEMLRVFRYLDAKQEPDRSFDAFLKSPKIKKLKNVQAKRLRDYIQSFHAADSALISERYLAKAENSSPEGAIGKSFRPTRGYASVCEVFVTLLKDELRLKHVVREIAWKKGAVEISGLREGKAFQISASKVLVTLPIGVLKSPPQAPNHVVFAPEPEGLRSAFAGIESGQILKLNLQFKNRFWENSKSLRDLAFFLVPPRDFSVWWTQVPVRAALLTGWMGGARAEKFLKLSGDEFTAHALDEVGKIFHRSRAALEKDFVRSYFHDWSQDPYARGAYSYIKVGGMRAQDFLRTPIEDTLYFAGEMLNPRGQTGTVDGAMASGLEAARKMARL